MPPMQPTCELTLITPMFNESAQIQENIRRILKSLDSMNLDYQYLLIDDGSTDDSYARAMEVLEDHPRAEVITYSPNHGRGYALRQGFARSRGQYVISTESDLSWGEEIIPKLYAALKETCSDVVLASVFLPGGGLENVPARRRWLSRFGNKFMRWAFGGGLTMLSGMTRGYRGDVIRSLDLVENRKEIHLEIVSKAQALGLSIREIPATIRWTDDRGKQTEQKRGLSIFRFILPHLMVSFSQASSKLLLSLAVILGGIGLVAVLLSAINKVWQLLYGALPNLLTYGLILCVAALLLAMLSLLSLQLRYVYRGLVLVQSRIKQLQNGLPPGQSRESGLPNPDRLNDQP